MLTAEGFIALLQGFHDGQLSESELQSFLEAVDDPRFEPLLGERLHEELARLKAAAPSEDPRAARVWEKIAPSVHAVKKAGRIRVLSTRWIRYAAAILIVLGVGAYLWTSKEKSKADTQLATGDIQPGRSGAILTLADGSKVNLDSLSTPTLPEQNGTQVLLKDGSLAYNAASAKAGEVLYNTMSTPKGRQFSVQLPDGTKAWLNAASSIRYPTAFTGAERSITVSGEVYLEVARDVKRPFKVKANDRAEIEVLGTSFDVKAYPDDADMRTTLLEGAVRLRTHGQAQTLRPGQQAIVRPNGEAQLVKNADIQKIMAWKNGLFNFQDESLDEVMKQLERWYDIDVKYIGDPPKQKFFGELGRDLTLSQVIETLREVGIRFSIEGRTLIVSH